MTPGRRYPGASIRQCERGDGSAEMPGRAAAEGIRVEVPRDNRGPLAQSLEQKSHLNGAAAHCSENFEVSVRHRDRAALAAIEPYEQRVTVSFAFLDSLGVVEAGWEQENFRRKNRKPRQDGVALDGRCVFAESQDFIVADSFCELFECFAED